MQSGYVNPKRSLPSALSPSVMILAHRQVPLSSPVGDEFGRTIIGDNHRSFEPD
jgi:hypothetical protein